MASVLVTGSNRGIGFRTVLTLARAGHKIYATMRDVTRGSELARTIAEEKLPVEIFAMDVDSDQSVATSMEAILSRAGSIDVLVNNAGIYRGGAIEELGIGEFKAVMETNYFGAIRCIRAVLPDMRRRGSGCIVNVTSVAGKIALSPMAPYTASKFALEALSEALAQEVKPFGIRVAIVEPGIIDTDMARGVARAEGGVYPQSRRIAGLFAASLKAPRDPNDVANVILKIIDGPVSSLRNTAGPDAVPFLQFRSGFNDEAWVDWGALDDEAWYRRVEKDFGIDAHPVAAA